MATSDYTLEDIRQHPAFPFQDWRKDDFQFLMLELYWAERVRTVLGDDMAGFAPLFDTDRDGNPILDVTNPGALRGLRLVVSENEEGKPVHPQSTGPGAFYPLYAFLNVGRLPDGETAVDELVLLVSLDERFSDHVDTFIRWHCIEAVSTEEVEALLAEYEDNVGMGDSDMDLSDP